MTVIMKDVSVFIAGRLFRNFGNVSFPLKEDNGFCLRRSLNNYFFEPHVNEIVFFGTFDLMNDSCDCLEGILTLNLLQNYLSKDYSGIMFQILVLDLYMSCGIKKFKEILGSCSVN